MARKLIIALFMTITTFAYANMDKMFQSVEPNEATLLQSGDSKLYCPNCGMNLPKFYKTGHAVKLKDGSHRQYCSIHCLVEEMELGVLKDKKDTIDEILVVDTNSLKMIDAKKAYYIVGSKIAGTMSMVSQYAFENIDDALAFLNTNGGEMKSFDEAYAISLEDFAKDIAMIQNKRSSGMYKNGEKIYQTMCDTKKLDSLHAHGIGELKALIAKEKVCKEDLNDGQLQALALYVWDIKLNNFEKNYGQNDEINISIKTKQDKNFLKRGENIHSRVCKELKIENLNSFDEVRKSVDSSCPKLKDDDRLALIAYVNHIRSGHQMHKIDPIVVPDHAKCPVCGMFVSKYPKWAAKTTQKDGKEFFYDGVKDMFKFIFQSSAYAHDYSMDDFVAIEVTDYYTLDKINAKDAFFVVGSTVYGPMGRELVPFKTKEDAQNFSKHYSGKNILKFNEVTKDLVFGLDK